MMNHFSTLRLINLLLFVLLGLAVLALTACQSNEPAKPLSRDLAVNVNAYKTRNGRTTAVS